ncbi:MAG: DUF2752 domain-containing protein [Spirochaetes bacterium]|nr:DUF2752 domain-containing protein [Spirochaetota bacterium]
MLIKADTIKAYIYPTINKFLFAAPFVIGFILYYLSPKLSICYLINLTHLPCPFCGLTRSFSFISHGELQKAFYYNWSIILWAPLFFISWVIQFLPLTLKKRSEHFLRKHLKLINLLFYLFLTIIIGYGIIRIVDSIYHFWNIPDVVPEKTLRKYFLKILSK